MYNIYNVYNYERICNKLCLFIKIDLIILITNRKSYIITYNLFNICLVVNKHEFKPKLYPVLVFDHILNKHTVLSLG